jgi:hypothetical protein
MHAGNRAQCKVETGNQAVNGVHGGEYRQKKRAPEGARSMLQTA